MYALNHITTESERATVSEIPTPTTVGEMQNIIETVSSTNNMVTKGQDQDVQDVLIGGAVIASVLGVTQVLLILAVVLLTVAILNVRKKYQKVITKQPDVQMKINSAYGVHSAGSQADYDFVN